MVQVSFVHIGIGTQVSLLVRCVTYVEWPKESTYLAVASGVCAVGFCALKLGVHKKGSWRKNLCIVDSQEHEDNVYFDKLLSMTFKAMIPIVFGLFLSEAKFIGLLGSFACTLGFLSLLWANLEDHTRLSRILLCVGISIEVSLLVLSFTYVKWPKESIYLAAASSFCAICLCVWKLGVFKKGRWSRSRDLYSNLSWD